MSKPYLRYFQYVDWESGDDDILRVGDKVLVVFQEGSTGAETTHEVEIVRHHMNNMPVFLYGNDWDGDYWDIGGMFLSGWEFSRL